MTSGHDDFEARLRASLGQHAGDVHHVDLADSALSKARRIRRRRNALSAASALVVAAIAVPVGLNVVDTDGDTDKTASEPTETAVVTPLKPVRVQIDGLDRGDPPSVPYLDDAEFTSDGETVVVPSTAGVVTDAAKVGGGTAVWSRDDTTGATVFSTDDEELTPLNGLRVTQPAIDRGSGGAAVWAVHRADLAGQPAEQDTIVYAAPDAGVNTVTTRLQVRQVMGASNGLVVFNAVDHGKQVVGAVSLAGSGDQVREPVAGLTTLTAVSPTLDRVAGVLLGRPGCTTVLTFETGQPDWAKCSWRPVEFSADGSRVLAVDSQSDGFGPRELAVLDATTGAVLGEFTTPGTFGRATFEDDDTIVTVLVVDEQAAIVRCDLAGACNLATPPQTVPSYEPDTLVEPYQLTAN